MEIIDLIRSRRIIKKFKSNPLDRTAILAWLEAATWAPNHRMTEPWEIIFIGPDTRLKLNHKSNFGRAPVVFAVLSHKGKNELEREENRSATSCFVQNFMLAAWAEGVGAFWSSIAASSKNRALLKVPEEYDVIGVLAAGYPEEVPNAKPRKSIAEKMKELP